MVVLTEEIELSSRSLHFSQSILCVSPWLHLAIVYTLDSDYHLKIERDFIQTRYSCLSLKSFYTELPICISQQTILMPNQDIILIKKST